MAEGEIQRKKRVREVAVGINSVNLYKKKKGRTLPVHEPTDREGGSRSNNHLLHPPTTWHFSIVG